MADAGLPWTDERVELLKKLWSDGLSASQIAAQMGGVTRNAVIGKVHRLGLSGRAKTSTAPAQPRPRKPARPPSHPMSHRPPAHGGAALAAHLRPEPQPQAEPLVAYDEDVVIPFSERVTIMELRDSMCRWPMGDPTTPEFRFCGGKAITGLPYCPHHSRIAYQPAAERRRERERRVAFR
ncbi:MAG: GcrA family cell cycle regulator [Microvirga sp.]|jgi:GcrA cell cycle regulator|nr:GcrA family cell cycle regulator [Beijerinckiaceae bacterium]HZY24132.1 GcrA family cell cycle regulator [Beijerinckiaceae bacterium]